MSIVAKWAIFIAVLFIGVVLLKYVVLFIAIPLAIWFLWTTFQSKDDK